MEEQMDSSVLPMSVDRAREVYLHTQNLLKNAADGYPSGVRIALANGAQLNAVDEEGWTALEYLLNKEDWQTAKELVDRGAMVADIRRSLGKDGFSPLHWAVWIRDKEWATKLLNAGAPVDQLSHSGWSPLVHALNTEQMEIADLLRAAGADVNLKLGGSEPSILTLMATKLVPKGVVWCLRHGQYEASGPEASVGSASQKGAPQDEIKFLVNKVQQYAVQLPERHEILGALTAYLEVRELAKDLPEIQSHPVSDEAVVIGRKYTL